MNNKLLLVDDDDEFIDLLSAYLTAEGFSVETASDGVIALEKLQDNHFAVCVLDMMMPNLNGIETLKQIRAHSSMPVLMLSAKAEPIDRILGLELGADDYLPKPVEPRELAARLKAIIRRTYDQPNTDPVAGIVWDDQKRVITVLDRELDLTGIEYEVLKILAQHVGQVVNKEELSKSALKRPLLPFDRSLDVHVSNIRKKIEGLNVNIKSVRGRGYQLII